MHLGLLVTLESIDGLGKTTQVTRLAQTLQGLGFDPFLTKEPGDAAMGSSVGPGVRELLFKKPGSQNLAPGVADCLFLADHTQNVFDIREQLKKGRIVLSDRYADSQFAYGSAATRRAPKWTLDIFREQYGVTPDLTILLVARGPQQFNVDIKLSENPDHVSQAFLSEAEDISWALARARARTGLEAGKQDGKGWDDVEQQRIIQNTYVDLLKTESRTRFINVWSDSSREAIAEEILGHVLVALKGEHPSQPFLTGMHT
jgi:dTMP kinase